jgi:uncharacterized repeat protein (TIGR03809 family)
MIDGEAYRKLGQVAQKWRNLAEQRNAHYAELYDSGRWKRYFPEDRLLQRMREVVATTERWRKLANDLQPQTGEATAADTTKPPSYRSAA